MSLKHSNVKDERNINNRPELKPAMLDIGCLCDGKLPLAAKASLRDRHFLVQDTVEEMWIRLDYVGTVLT